MGFEWICTRAAGTVGQVVATRRMLLTPRVSNGGFCDENEVFAVRCKGGPFKIPYFDEDRRAGRRFPGRPGADLPLRRPPGPHQSVLARLPRCRSGVGRGAPRTGPYRALPSIFAVGCVGNARTALFLAMGDWKPFPPVSGSAHGRRRAFTATRCGVARNAIPFRVAGQGVPPPVPAHDLPGRVRRPGPRDGSLPPTLGKSPLCSNTLPCPMARLSAATTSRAPAINFQILGGSRPTASWSGRRRTDLTYLYWYAQGSRRQHLYEHMISYLAARGSPWRRLEVDPITGNAVRARGLLAGA